MKHGASVLVRRLRSSREPEPLLLPLSSADRSSFSLLHERVTVPSGGPARVSRRRVCEECCAPADADACFCGWCGTLLPRL